MHVRQGFVEAERAQDRADRLANLVRIDAQHLALEVEFLVFLGRGPLEHLLDFFRRMRFFKNALAGEGILVFRLVKQGKTLLDGIDILAHIEFLNSLSAPIIGRGVGGLTHPNPLPLNWGRGN